MTQSREARKDPRWLIGRAPIVSDPAVPRSDEPRTLAGRALASRLYGRLPGTEWSNIIASIEDEAAASIPSPSSEDGLRAELVELQAALDAEMASVTPDYKGVARLAIAVLKRALSTPPAPAPDIDVERLARALKNHYQGNTGELETASWTEIAETAAAEYSRLSDPTDPTDAIRAYDYQDEGLGGE